MMLMPYEEESPDLKQRCERLFSDWLKTSYHPTWGYLLKCIKQVDDLTAAANEIEIELQTSCKLMHDIYLLLAFSLDKMHDFMIRLQ